MALAYTDSIQTINAKLAEMTGINSQNTGIVVTPSNADQAIPAGRYDGTVASGKVAGDADLVAANIKDGVSIFGVTGTVKQKATFNQDLFTNCPKIPIDIEQPEGTLWAVSTSTATAADGKAYEYNSAGTLLNTITDAYATGWLRSVQENYMCWSGNAYTSNIHVTNKAGTLVRNFVSPSLYSIMAATHEGTNRIYFGPVGSGTSFSTYTLDGTLVGTATMSNAMGGIVATECGAFTVGNGGEFFNKTNGSKVTNYYAFIASKNAFK